MRPFIKEHGAAALGTQRERFIVSLETQCSPNLLIKNNE